MKKYGIQAALLAAMVFFTTAYVMHIPIGIGSGYIHLGDVVVYLAAALLISPAIQPKRGCRKVISLKVTT